MEEELKKTKAELDIYEVACELVLNELEKQEMITQSTKIKKEFLKIDPVYDNIYNGKIINKLLKIIQKDMKKHKKRIDKFFIVDLSFILEEKIKNYNLLNYQQVDKITSKELIKKFDVDADKDFFIFLKKLIWEYYLLTERKYSIEQDIKNHESKNNKKESLINYRTERKEKEKKVVSKNRYKESEALAVPSCSTFSQVTKKEDVAHTGEVWVAGPKAEGTGQRRLLCVLCFGSSLPFEQNDVLANTSFTGHSA